MRDAEATENQDDDEIRATRDGVHVFSVFSHLSVAVIGFLSNLAGSAAFNCLDYSLRTRTDSRLMAMHRECHAGSFFMRYSRMYIVCPPGEFLPSSGDTFAAAKSSLKCDFCPTSTFSESGAIFCRARPS